MMMMPNDTDYDDDDDDDDYVSKCRVIRDAEINVWKMAEQGVGMGSKKKLKTKFDLHILVINIKSNHPSWTAANRRLSEWGEGKAVPA